MSAEQMWEENPEVAALPEPEAKVLPMHRQVPGYPTNWQHEHLDRLFAKHPRLRGTEVAYMAESLYEGWTWNA